ncbi:alpha/beta hydrolase [Pedobacter sp. Du54]|uniref:alpha/beta fold hydrolase n=1 Tax=Pedobacter anseongensis TaxID=3133439 RepID=UPI0030983C21
MPNTYAPKQTNAKGHSIQVGNIEMYYEEYGSGKPLVLLHGFGGCSQNWHPFISELSEHYKLISIDLRGHGYSTNPEGKFTHGQAANDVFGLLDKLEIDEFSAMGMSTGGMVLLHMATSEPKRIKEMVLISTTSHFPDQARAIMRRASFNTMPQEVINMYRECAKRGEEQIHQLLSNFNAFAENFDDMNFTEQRLSTITARTLIVHGECDQFFPVEIPETISRAIPNATLWIIPGGEHVPIYNPAVPFTSTALKFLT